ncbi:tryptophan halogenase family protein [Sphingomonas qomolangmaensis]|uniref:Tryptophan 7-halogenase n=1 Tax=Sphingomonas qomolangmaensis TaxID=2918765 RepID=A0ABY5L698_9SPHN|nr:tryptophan halogenase family protein [Sphingomonas qomolangmaensis]UUL82480.1 tryptophan 7-halogenase [Sphingomonas qomolangmaensis]
MTQRIVVLGGGTAGWMAAATAARLLGPAGWTVTLIESDAIPTVGVGEATIPPIRTFHAMLGIDEADFLGATGGSWKLGIRFEGWSGQGSSYLHAFGRPGTDIGGLPFHAQWLRARAAGQAEALERYWLEARAAEEGRFAHPLDNGDSPLSRITYAYHFDAGHYTTFLRRHAEAMGAARVEGTVEGVERGAAGIAALVLADGRRIEGDLFLDCSGFASLLVGEALGVGWVDWSHWLPCDRAVAVASAADTAPLPLTRSIAHAAGWQWRIPLRHRTGNGRVFCSAYLSEDEATAELLASLETPPTAEPRVLRFSTGHRQAFWAQNCVALGLASGFMEPLESTSIHLVQAGLQHLLQHLPGAAAGPDAVAATRARYNRVMTTEFERIRDFLVAHYYLNQRPERFWHDRRAQTPPPGLAEKLALFAGGGRLFREDDELFNAWSWLALLTGQGAPALGHDPVCDAWPLARVADRLARIEAVVTASLDHMPPHAEALARLEPLPTDAALAAC